MSNLMSSHETKTQQNSTWGFLKWRLPKSPWISIRKWSNALDDLGVAHDLGKPQVAKLLTYVNSS